MPIYDYSCPNGHRFDLRQSFQDPAGAACPECGSESKRVIHAPEVVYKGSGFYTSDQRQNGFGSYWYNREAAEDRGAPEPENVADMGSGSADSA